VRSPAIAPGFALPQPTTTLILCPGSGPVDSGGNSGKREYFRRWDALFGMDALIIGPSAGLADAVAQGLRRRGLETLRAIAADAADGERAAWLLDEAGDPPLVVVFDAAPYAVAHELLARTRAHIVLVVEQRAAAAHTAALPARSLLPRDEAGLTVVPLGRAGRRWFARGGGRQEPLGIERAAALVLRACGAGAVSYR
jgi:hypothetical protein